MGKAAILLISAPLVGACFGRSSSPPSVDASFDLEGGAFDGSEEAEASPGEEASAPESGTRDATVGDTGSSFDAPPEVSAVDAADANAPPTLLTMVGVTTTNIPYAGAYVAGTWSANAIGADIFSPGGGGIAVLDGSHALSVLRGNMNTAVEAAPFSATWSNLANIVASGVSYTGAPVATSTGAAVVYQNGVGGYALYAARYAAASATWTTTTESLGAMSDNLTVPWLVETSTTELVLSGSTSNSYQSVSGTGGTWSSAIAIPGTTRPSSETPAIEGVRRAGTNDVIAAWTEDGTPAPMLMTGVWSGGTWTVAPTALATDLGPNEGGRPFTMTALPDGRVALAYVNSSSALELAFYDGAAWGAFAMVPVPVTTLPRVPAALAAGIGGTAVLELAYLDANRHAQHTRLTSEAPVTWSASTAIDATNAYDKIELASGP
jgi:hypothetical protein